MGGNTLDAVINYSANTVTLLVLENNLPFVRVLVDTPEATSTSDVQVKYNNL